MKVFALVRSVQYEGCSYPSGIYKTRKRAEKAETRYRQEDTSPYYDLTIYEYELDKDTFE